VTKRELLALLEPYGPDEDVVFVTFEDGIVVHETCTVAKDHCTHRTGPGGSIHMPVAIYLVGEGVPGTPGVLGASAADLLAGFAWPEPDRTVLAAAEALLAAKADGMLTAAEWEALQRAVAAARPPRCPGCGTGLTDHVHDPDGRRVCGACGHAWDEPDPGS